MPLREHDQNEYVAQDAYNGDDDINWGETNPPSWQTIHCCRDIKVNYPAGDAWARFFGSGSGCDCDIGIIALWKWRDCNSRIVWIEFLIKLSITKSRHCRQSLGYTHYFYDTQDISHHVLDSWFGIHLYVSAHWIHFAVIRLNSGTITGLAVSCHSCRQTNDMWLSCLNLSTLFIASYV